MSEYSAPRYRNLGLRPVINAAATLTVLGGSRLAPGVSEAMAAASQDFVDLPELQRAVGARIAELTGNAAGYVTSGGSAAVTLSVAGCLSSDIDTFGPPGEVGAVAMFSGHRNAYDYAVRQLGARIVEFEADPASITASIETGVGCVLWFAGEHYSHGAPELETVLARAHALGVPVIVDAAAQIPPIRSLWRFTAELGADAVLFSGGKGLRGPQSSGLLLGRTELIEAARAHGAPNHAVGRGMKVGKEELLGLLAAVEWALEQDEAAMLERYEETVRLWVERIGALPEVSAWRDYPSEAGQPHGRAMIRPPRARSPEHLVAALWDRDPRIAVLTVDQALALNPQTIDPGEEFLVLEAFEELLG